MESEFESGFTSGLGSGSGSEVVFVSVVGGTGVGRMVLGQDVGCGLGLESVVEGTSVSFIATSLAEDMGFCAPFGVGLVASGLETSAVGDWVCCVIMVLLVSVSIRAFLVGGSNAEVSLLTSSDVRFRPAADDSVAVGAVLMTAVLGVAVSAIV